VSNNDLLAARQQRLERFDAAKLMLGQVELPAVEPGLDWDTLLKLPQWCCWPKPEQLRLILVAGALFSAPAMRLWIDASRIRVARELIGDNTFERVMANDAVPKEPIELMSSDNVEALFLSTGAAVLLGSTHKALQHYVSCLLPDSAGDLPSNIAQLLLSQALSTLTAINQFNESRQTTEDDVDTSRQEGAL